MGSVAVVTDSTADLPAALVDEVGLRIVPMSVMFGDQAFVSGVDLDDDGFYRLLRRPGPLPTTSQPSPVFFDETYAACAAQGHTAVVSLHLSAELSSTYAVARDRAVHAPLPVEVVDTRLVGAPLGLAALAAQQAAETGGGIDEVRAAAERVRDRATCLLVVDTLEHLRRGGRVSSIQAKLGDALKVKPILQLVDGTLELREKTRTWSRALDRVADVLVAEVGDVPVDLAVMHAMDAERADALWERLESRLHGSSRLDGVIGPVVGSHVGPGAIVATAVPRDV